MPTYNFFSPLTRKSVEVDVSKTTTISQVFENLDNKLKENVKFISGTSTGNTGTVTIKRENANRTFFEAVLEQNPNQNCDNSSSFIVLTQRK